MVAVNQMLIWTLLSQGTVSISVRTECCFEFIKCRQEEVLSHMKPWIPTLLLSLHLITKLWLHQRVLERVHEIFQHNWIFLEFAKMRRLFHFALFSVDNVFPFILHSSPHVVSFKPIVSPWLPGENTVFSGISACIFQALSFSPNRSGYLRLARCIPWNVLLGFETFFQPFSKKRFVWSLGLIFMFTMNERTIDIFMVASSMLMTKPVLRIYVWVSVLTRCVHSDLSTCNVRCGAAIAHSHAGVLGFAESQTISPASVLLSWSQNTKAIQARPSPSDVAQAPLYRGISWKSFCESEAPIVPGPGGHSVKRWGSSLGSPSKEPEERPAAWLNRTQNLWRRKRRHRLN